MHKADINATAADTNSFIQEIFQGSTQDKIICANNECGKETIGEPQPFLNLSLALATRDLMRCLEVFCSEETFSENDQYLCLQYSPNSLA